MSEYLETTVDKFVFRVAADRLYGAEGVWVQAQDGNVRVGMTDYLQQRSGDVAFAHVKPVGTKLAAGDELAEIETVKANVSLFSPIGGTVVEVNTELDRGPEIINESPYEKGWLAVIEAADWESDRAKLLDPQAYLSAMRSQAEQELIG
ncbi:MAG: glycine cleavage system protein H [Thermoguttaceae bacterium]